MNLFQSRSREIATTAILFFLIIFGLLLPGLPWSAYFHHQIKKVVRKAEMKISKWKGSESRLLCIAGISDLPGARGQALYSPSGWATFCDAKGEFKLSYVAWYPGAAYDLVFSDDETTGQIIQVDAPSTYPPSGIMNAGNLAVRSAQEVNLTDLLGDTSYSYERFDWQNRDYYRHLYDSIIQGTKPDELKLAAINHYVSERLNYKETQWDLGSPRRVIEYGSQYCGHLADTMATLLAVGYPVRVIHLKDEATPPHTHVVIEVFYEGGWHLYDPTFGIAFLNASGKVASYKELRLNPQLISRTFFPDTGKNIRKLPWIIYLPFIPPVIIIFTIWFMMPTNIHMPGGLIKAMCFMSCRGTAYYWQQLEFV